MNDPFRSADAPPFTAKSTWLDRASSVAERHYSLCLAAVFIVGTWLVIGVCAATGASADIVGAFALVAVVVALAGRSEALVSALAVVALVAHALLVAAVLVVLS